jgi:hypothetical protein
VHFRGIILKIGPHIGAAMSTEQQTIDVNIATVLLCKHHALVCVLDNTQNRAFVIQGFI